MLKLLRWPAAFVLLAFFVAWPIAAGLFPLVWLMTRALYGYRPGVVLLNLAIITLPCMLLLSGVLGIPLLAALAASACLIAVCYKPAKPAPKSKPAVDDQDVIDVEVISVTTIYKENQ